MTLHGKGLLGAALLLAAACGSGGTVAGTAPPGSIVVVAENLVFLPRTVNAPAGEQFVLYFDNRDSVLHNVRVVDGAGQNIMAGEVFTGPGARVADVPALAVGTYRLLCDVHPGMTGELIAQQ